MHASQLVERVTGMLINSDIDADVICAYPNLYIPTIVERPIIAVTISQQSVKPLGIGECARLLDATIEICVLAPIDMGYSAISRILEKILDCGVATNSLCATINSPDSNKVHHMLRQSIFVKYNQLLENDDE